MKSKKGMIIEIEGYSIDINKIGYISPVKEYFGGICNEGMWYYRFEIILNDGKKIDIETKKYSKEMTGENFINENEELKKEAERKREFIFNKWKKGKTVYYIK